MRLRDVFYGIVMFFVFCAIVSHFTGKSVALSSPSELVGPPTLSNTSGLMLTIKPLDVYAAQMTYRCGADLSDARRTILSSQLARIAAATFATREHQEAFILMVCNESAFNTKAHSQKDAVGLSQLLPKYASEFAGECGLGAVAAEDLGDAETNLTIGACHFKRLLEQWDGNIGLALGGYNSGGLSASTKRLNAGMASNQETDGYLARWLVMKEKSK